MTLLHQAAQKAVEAPNLEDRAWVLAQNFHAVYERLAPDFGYETRPETRGWVADSPNGKLMRAVCSELLRNGEIAAALQQQPEPVASIVYEAYSKTGSYLFASEEGADEFASRFPATAAMSVRTRPIIGAALQQQEVPREPVATDRLEQIIDGYLEDYEMVGEAEDGRDACHQPTEGERILIKDAILGLLGDEEWDAEWGRLIAERVAASPSTTQQQEAGSFDEWVAREWPNATEGERDVAWSAWHAAAPSTPESAEKDDAGGGNAPGKGQQ